ncbi:hypothetical protein L6452_34538 [Arctium lappa]|uniref:Uncharacterized protein n=1 Tax=Arctium lappa TaxID=4217 RepID=A0ACB8YHU9_ARCLA|nr:hypothetical protein L6452_34538 [Arctium lappa]
MPGDMMAARDTSAAAGFGRSRHHEEIVVLGSGCGPVLGRTCHGCPVGGRHTYGGVPTRMIDENRVADDGHTWNLTVVILLTEREIKFLEIPLTDYKGATSYLASLSDALVLALVDQIKRHEYDEVLKMCC